MARLLIVSTISRFLRDFLLPYATHFRAQGWRVDALTHDTSTYPECQAAFDHLWEVNWSRNPLDPRNLHRTPQFIQTLVEREGYDIVHVHTPVAAFVTRFALRQRKSTPAMIYTAHGFHFHPAGHPLKNFLFAGLERRAGRWTDYLIVINHEDEHAARHMKLIAPEQLRYMPGIGVDHEGCYHPAQVDNSTIGTIRRELGLKASERYFAMVAEFIPRKRHADALRAFSYIIDPTVHLVFVGCGQLEQPVREMAHDLGLQRRVHFLGFRRDAAAIMRGAQATLLPSAQEGLPRCILESMSLEVPVIATDIRGVREMPIRECGKLVALGDITALAQAMHWIVQHPEDAAMLGKQGRAHLAPYTLHRLLTMHEDLYAEALGAPTTIMSSVDEMRLPDAA